MTMAALRSVNTSERRRARAKGRRGPAQQTDLFGNGRPSTVVDTPAWQDLPAATQAVLTSLMARLILDYVKIRQAGSMTEAGHDL